MYVLNFTTMNSPIDFSGTSHSSKIKYLQKHVKDEG